MATEKQMLTRLEQPDLVSPNCLIFKTENFQLFRVLVVDLRNCIKPEPQVEQAMYWTFLLISKDYINKYGYLLIV